MPGHAECDRATMSAAGGRTKRSPGVGHDALDLNGGVEWVAPHSQGVAATETGNFCRAGLRGRMGRGLTRRNSICSPIPMVIFYACSGLALLLPRSAAASGASQSSGRDMKLRQATFIPTVPLRSRSEAVMPVKSVTPSAVHRVGALPARSISASMLPTPPRCIGDIPLTTRAAAASSIADNEVDDNRWLEDVLAPEALKWVESRNKETVERLGEPEQSKLHPRLLSIYNSKEKIPYAAKRGEHFYNFWQDAENPRGLWRRTTEEEYAKSDPEWEVLLDIDQLGKDEGVSWVWGGSTPLDEGPSVRSGRVLISLSRGGADATVTREFDTIKKAWVGEEEQGFSAPEAKGGASYRSRDELLIGTDLGPDTVTDSGYPRQIRLWKRGEPLESAKVVFEGEASDVSVSGYVSRHGEHRFEWRTRATSFYTSRKWVRALPLGGPTPDEEGFVEVPVQESASTSMFGAELLVLLRDEWATAAGAFPAGALLSAPLEEVLRLGADAAFKVVFAPTASRSLQNWSRTKNFLVVTVLDNVCTRLQVLRLDGGAWQPVGGEGPAEIATLGVGVLDADEGDRLWVQKSSYLSPPELSLGDAASLSGGSAALREVKRLPAQFDAAGCDVRQGFATSSDGTKVPYFVVSPAGAPSGGRPTVIEAYGGFEVPLLPGYRADVGAGWLEKGGVYVVANLRGGGEFGPEWHKAAQRERRQRAYEDLFAVSEALISDGVCSAKQLAVKGGSNGGLLVGNALVQRPDLYGAILCAVPLLDMQRYHKLLAGASWVAEYGDPDSSDWEYLKKISPYHNVDPKAKYPPVLFTTSTRDDRVHPGHARKMVKRLIDKTESAGNVYYYENIEGGHGGAADSKQRAYVGALSYDFLWRMLSGK